MQIHELVIEMKLLERRLTLYEEEYGVLSEDFYAALTSGELADYDAYDESRADFSRWKGIYETLRRRKYDYRKQLEGRDLAEVLRSTSLLVSANSLNSGNCWPLKPTTTWLHPSAQRCRRGYVGTR